MPPPAFATDGLPRKVFGIDDWLHRRQTQRGQTLRGRVNHRASEPPQVLLRPPQRIAESCLVVNIIVTIMKWRNCLFSVIKSEGAASVGEYSQEQEMSMRTIRTRTIACAVAIAAVLSLAPLRAETTQAALSKEAGTLSDKFAGLARVMAGEYNWKPGEGVRSGGDVFKPIVT